MKPAKRRIKGYKPTKPGGVMQPGTVDWGLSRRRELKAEREAKLHWAELQATRQQRERETPSFWAALISIFRR